MSKKNKFWLFIFIRTAANSLIIFGIIFAFVTLRPYVGAELKYWFNQRQEVNYAIEGEEVKPSEEESTIKIRPVNTDFGLVIEKIDVNAPVVGGVDASNYDEYMAALTKGVAQAKGTALPGSKTASNNNVYLFAHSAGNPIEAKRYNSVFYLLRKLEKGDRVVTFYQNKRFDYIVFDKKTVDPSDIQYLTDSSKEPILTLQTCDPPGSSLRRLIVIGKLVG